MKIKRFNESIIEFKSVTKDNVLFLSSENVLFLSSEEKKEYDKMKFKLGEFVRNLRDKLIYEIVLIELFGTDKYPYKIENKIRSFWKSKDELEKVPDYEIDAIKYNL